MSIVTIDFSKITWYTFSCISLVQHALRAEAERRLRAVTVRNAHAVMSLPAQRRKSYSKRKEEKYASK